jgi:hypothetical protein
MSDLTQKQKAWTKTGFNPATDGDDINKFVEFRLQRWTKYKFRDEGLWDMFKEDFFNFDLEAFRLIDKDLLYSL